MPHFCAVKTCTNTAKPGAALSFHRIPTREPKRLKLWLVALNMDVNTPVSELRKYIVCSDHFVPGDYTGNGRLAADNTHRFLTPTAVPTVGVSRPTAAHSEDDRTGDASSDARSSKDIQSVLPSSQQRDQVDQCNIPAMEDDSPNDTEVGLPKSDPTTNCEPLTPSTAVSANENMNDGWNRSDGPSSPQHSYSIEVYVDLEQPPREEKCCRICGKTFRRDSHLISHVDKSHKGHKAFKCMECNKEFEQRYQLVMHVRIHTGERPFSCQFCGKTFAQNSSRLAHLRMHTGEKPYFCAKCGKGFASSNHFRVCRVQNVSKVTPEKGKVDERLKEEKVFKCFECNKAFGQKHQLARHAKIHTGEKPFSCDFCDKTFTQNYNRMVHMRQHTKEKPYFCDKCGKRFTRRQHLKFCTATKNESTNKSFRCTTCGKTFHTDPELKVHTEVHESWKRHISEKLQGQV